MKKTQLFFTNLAIIALSALVLVGCKKDDDDPSPVASFTAEYDGKTVAFTNTSTNATSYEWNFGDDSDISTEVNPTHTYAAYGDYDVRLTATGSGGSVTGKTTISVIKNWPVIGIDGDFSDWDAVPDFYTGGADSGELLEAKVSYDGAGFLLFYIKGTDNIGPVLEVFINTDNDLTTGWNHSIPWYAEDGTDFAVEYVVEDFLDDYGDDIVSGATIYGYEIDPAVNPDAHEDWPWVTEISTEGVAETSGYVGNEVEFSVDISNFAGISTEQISLYIWALDTGWGDDAWLPGKNTDPLSTPLIFNFQE